MERSELLRWIECHPALGSYFTLAAIFVAIVAVWLPLRSEQKRNKAHGRVTAFRLAPHIVIILGQATRAREFLHTRAAQQTPATMISLENYLKALSVEAHLPENVFAETWTLPPHIALAVAQLESRLSAHAEALPLLASRIMTNDQASRVQGLKALDASLDSIIRLGTEIAIHSGAVADRVVRWRRFVIHLKSRLPWNKRSRAEYGDV